uniref:HAT C-terminal dimerisation domain-containing protein n=1 Tax=Sinocyclocheilus anshuiensis TaxID=1608454 RepID=A0A671NNQ0_9TELE
FNTTHAVILATFKISWLLVKHGKPFSDGELVKNCFLESQCLFDYLSNKSETIPLSLAADESTDIGDVAQLCIWVRCVNSETFEVTEDLLALKLLHERTRDEDIHRALSEACKDMNIPASSVVSITTYGAPSMTGKHKGLVAEMQNICPDLLAFHCIVHQQALYSKLVDGYFVEVMDTVVNFIRARPLMNRRFIALLDEIDSAYGDLILHSEVRWLSSGKVLHRFLAVLPEIVHFLNDIGEGERFPVLRENEWKTNAAFLADVTAHLNKLNLQLQGDEKHVDDLLGCVEFQNEARAVHFTTQRCHTTQQSSSVAEMWQNISGQNLRLLNSKVLSIFGSTYICERTFSVMTCIKSRFPARLTDCNLQLQLHCAEFHQIGLLLTTSGVPLMVSRIILSNNNNKSNCNHLDTLTCG